MLGAGADRRPAALGRLRDADGVGRRQPPPQGPHQRRDAARRPHRGQVRRRGHRPVPHRAHVLPARPHRRHAGDDPGRRRRGAEAGRWPRSCRCSAPTSSSCSRSWPACRSPSACSTRRCTSSCRTRRRSSRRWRRRPASSVKTVRRRLAELKETNPMLGLRGCRLGILFPEIYEMQARAIFEAAFQVEARRPAETVVPEVMIPLVLAARELQLIKQRIDAVAAEVGEGAGRRAGLPGRHHDRAAARGPARRRDRRSTPTSSASAPTTSPR